MREKKQVTLNGEQVEVYQIEHDSNGNPRYVIHFLSLGIKLDDYGKIPNLTKYRAKWFAGGYVFQSHNIREDLGWALGEVNKYYNKQKALNT